MRQAGTQSLVINFLYFGWRRKGVEGKKEDKKELKDGEIPEEDQHEPVLDGKGLHDFYRHTTKLIK